MQLKTVLLILIGVQVTIFGSLYSFPLWLPDVKDLLHTSQQQLNVVGGLIYIGAFAGMITTPILLGLGFRVTFVVIALLDTAGYGGLYFITQFASSNDWVYVLMLAALVVGCATGILYSSVMGITVGLFGDKASPLLNGFCAATYGLGAIIPSVVYFAGWSNIRPLLLGLFAAHVACAFTFTRMPSIVEKLNAEKPVPPQETPKDSSSLIKKNDMTTKEAFIALISGPESWLVLIIALLMVPVGTTFATNIPGIVESLDGDEDRIGEISLIFNIVQTAARFSVALLALACPNVNPTLPLTFFTGVGFGTVTLVAHFTITKSNVIAFVVVFSVFYGWMWCVNGAIYSYVSISTEKYFSLIMATINPATGVLSLLLNWLVGYLYDRKASGNSCTGSKCFSTSLLILGIIASLMPVVVIILWFTKRKQGRSYIPLNG